MINPPKIIVAITEHTLKTSKKCNIMKESYIINQHKYDVHNHVIIVKVYKIEIVKISISALEQEKWAREMKKDVQIIQIVYCIRK